MGYIPKEVYDWHIERVWEKRKAAEKDSQQVYWNRVLRALKADLEDKAFPDLFGGT